MTNMKTKENAPAEKSVLNTLLAVEKGWNMAIEEVQKQIESIKNEAIDKNAGNGVIQFQLGLWLSTVHERINDVGCDSDPRFFAAVPDKWKFFRAANLEYIRPNYKGRLMYNNDVVYMFGDPPPSKPGQHVIPGRFVDTDSRGKQTEHPCPRKIAHVQWIVKWWSTDGEIVCDPFMGSGTTNLAAAKMGIKSIGIEYEERFCEMAAKRFAQTRMFAPCEIG